MINPLRWFWPKAKESDLFAGFSQCFLDQIHKFVEHQSAYQQRVIELFSDSPSQTLDRLLGALDSTDPFFLKELFSTLMDLPNTVFLPFWVAALGRATTSPLALQHLPGLLNHAETKPAFREGVFPHVIPHISSAQGRAVALSIDPQKASAAVFALPDAALDELHPYEWTQLLGVSKLKLPSETLERLATRLSKVSNPEVAFLCDQLMHKIASDGDRCWDDALQNVTDTGEHPRGYSRAFERLEKMEGDAGDKIHTLDQLLEVRIRQAGADIGWDDNRELELKYLTYPEWVIRVANHYIVGAENPGNLYEYFDSAKGLIPQFDELGLPGVANTLRKLTEIAGREDAANTTYDNLAEHEQEAHADEWDAVWESFQEEKSSAESECGAEGWDGCNEAFWRFAKDHRQDILPERMWPWMQADITSGFRE